MDFFSLGVEVGDANVLALGKVLLEHRGEQLKKALEERPELLRRGKDSDA